MVDAETAQITMVGVVDGQRRSLGARWFMPDGARPIEVAMSDDLLEYVAEFSASGNRVSVTLDLVTTYPRDAAHGRSSYALQQITQQPEAPTLNLAGDED